MDCCVLLQNSHSIDEDDEGENEDKNAVGNAIDKTVSVPREVLGDIFRKLTNPIDRSSLRLVCCRWKDILDQLVGIPMRIGTPSEYDPEYRPNSDTLVYHSPHIISHVGIDKLIVGNLTENWETNQSWLFWAHRLLNYFLPPQPNAELPQFMSADLVYLLNFCGTIVPKYFLYFFQELPWIRILSIGYISLNSLDAAMLEGLDIPTLEILVIRGGVKVFQQRRRLYQEWNMEQILENILALGKNYFPRLKYAGMDYIYDNDRGLEITKNQLTFLQRHVDTIQQYAMEYCLLVNDDFRLLAVPEHHPELTTIIKSLKFKLDLKGLRLIPVCIHKLPYFDAWMDVIKMQHSLAEFTIIGVLYSTNMLQTVVDKNFSHLTVLFIWEIILFDTETREILQLDCSIFNKCERLKKFSIQGWTVSLSVENIVNTEQLPKSLVEIDIRDVAVLSEDVRKIALEMPNLKSLELHFIGNKQRMGMTEPILRDIIQQRRISECRIIRSFNGNLTEGIYNGSDQTPAFIKPSQQGVISFKLSSNGYYLPTSFTSTA